MARISRPGLGSEALRDFTDLQRQAGERIAPLRTRQQVRRRRQLRRMAVRGVALLSPLVLVMLLAANVGGSRSWVDNRWGDLSRSSTGQPGPPADQVPGGY